MKNSDFSLLLKSELAVKNLQLQPRKRNYFWTPNYGDPRTYTCSYPSEFCAFLHFSSYLKSYSVHKYESHLLFLPFKRKLLISHYKSYLFFAFSKIKRYGRNSKVARVITNSIPYFINPVIKIEIQSLQTSWSSELNFYN